MIKFIVLLVLLSIAQSQTVTRYNPDNLQTVSLGSYVTHTLGGVGSWPVSVGLAAGQGFNRASNCVEGLGILYTPSGGVRKDAPLSAYYTADGKLAGLKMTIYGRQDRTLFSKGIGNAAQDNLITQGFWIPEGNGWSLSVSFRAPGQMCSGNSGAEVVGDRLVINQMKGGIARNIPLTARDALRNKFEAGSCMAKMGQHWFYDLATAPKMSWKSRNLLPIVPMYYTTGPNIGLIQAFFFTSPVCQSKVNNDWDKVPVICGLTADLMCENWCNKACKWDTSWWATQHVFFNKDPTTVKCANPVKWWRAPILAAAGGECPKNTPTPI